MKQKLVVIGAGMASGRAIEHLVETAPDAFEITLFNAEKTRELQPHHAQPCIVG